jgi:hypothetical protein
VGIDALQFFVSALLAFEPHPHPRNPQPHQLFHVVRFDDVRRTEHVERPRFAVLLDELQQPQRALLTRTPMACSSPHMTRNNSSPVS